MTTRIVYRSISMSDLEVAGYKITIDCNELDEISLSKVYKDGIQIPLKNFYKALNFLGLVLNKHLTLQDSCHHVRLNGEKTFNFRFTGEERNDERWLKSGFASDEAYLNSSKMGGMINACMEMQRGGDRKKTT